MKKKLTLLFALLCASVMGWAEPVTYTGAGFSGAINSYTYDIGYSITYDDDHHLTFNVTLDGSFQETDGFVFEIWSSDLSNGDHITLVKGEGNQWSVKDEKDYSTMVGQPLNQLRLRMASSQGGTDQLYLSDYTVGLSGSAVVNGPMTRATTPSAPSNKVKAIYSWYYAKGCNFTDWGGGTSSQNMRYGKKLSCTRPEGNGWLGLVDFGDLDCSAMDKFHMDIWVENDASMRLTPIHYGFGEEYRHVINLTGGQWNSIELDLNAETFVSDASVGAPNDYWDVINQFKIDLLANGLDFWIDNVYFYSNQSPVFTSISITGPTICKVGQNIPLTIETLDQFGQHIDAEFTCSVSPVSAGTVVGTTYTPSAKGAATITATSGLISNSLNVYNYEGDNLAWNKLESQSTEFSGYGAARAVDGNDGTEWQGSPTNGTAEDKASRTYDCWFSVDLGGGVDAKYDIDLVTIHFEGACSDAYKLYGSTDNSAWTEMYSWEYLDPQNGNRTNNHTDLITSSNLTNNSNVRYIKFLSTRAASQWGVKIFEFQVFGSESNTLTKSVSASVNDVAMGTATVTQNSAAVTEVTTGSEVTFSAVANDGYIFVNWSNDETRATFDAVVNSAMNLTANFRALGTIYCNTEMTASGHTIYVTLKKSGENEYKLIVNSTEELSNFGGTVMYKPNNTVVKDLRDQGVLSNSNHTLTGTMTSDRDIYFGTPLYVVFAGVGEITYSVDQGVANTPEFAVPCADAVTTGVALSQTSANLLLGSTLTLTPSFTPAYATDRALTWETSNPSIATVDGGVVTPVATGSVTITAKLTSNNSVYATCNVTVVDALTPATWYGYSTIQPQEGFTAYTYSITRNANQTLTFTMTTDKNIVGYVSGITGDVTGSFSGYTAETHSGSFTTEGTYTDNDPLNLQLTFASANYGATPLAISYRVGSSNDALGQAIAIDESIDNTTILTTYDEQTVVGVVKRSFTAGKLYTLVLPFDVDAAQTATKLPGSLTKLQNTIVKENGDLRINFVDVDVVEAGVPYLYTPSADVANPVFAGVTVHKELVPTEPDSYAKYYGIYAPLDGDALHNKANAYVLGPDQYLYAVSDLPENQTMRALRGYFVLNFPSGSSGMPRARVIFNSHETETATGVESIHPSDVSYQKVLRDGQILIIREGKTYNAQGQLIK